MRQRGGVGGWAVALPAARLPERLRITSVIRQFGGVPRRQNAYNAGTLYAGRRPRWRPSNRGGSRAAAVAGLIIRPFPAPP